MFLDVGVGDDAAPARLTGEVDKTTEPCAFVEETTTAGTVADVTKVLPRLSVVVTAATTLALGAATTDEVWTTALPRESVVLIAMGMTTGTAAEDDAATAAELLGAGATALLVWAAWLDCAAEDCAAEDCCCEGAADEGVAESAGGVVVALLACLFIRSSLAKEINFVASGGLSLCTALMADLSCSKMPSRNFGCRSWSAACSDSSGSMSNNSWNFSCPSTISLWVSDGLCWPTTKAEIGRASRRTLRMEIMLTVGKRDRNRWKRL